VTEVPEEPAVATPPRTKRRPPGKDDPTEKAKAQILRYTKFCICDVADAASMETALAGMPGCNEKPSMSSWLPCSTSDAWLRVVELLVPPDLADQQFRLWLVDSSMCLEGPENFTHNHNPYTRTPPFGKVFLHLGRRALSLFSCRPS